MSPVRNRGEASPSFSGLGTAKTKLSLTEFAEQFESAVKENQDLVFRLGKALDEVAAMTQLHQRARAELDAERSRLKSEMASLRVQLTNAERSANQIPQQTRAEMEAERSRLNSEIESLRAQLAKAASPSQRSIGDDPRLQSLLAAKEKLIRDEFERKLQELTVEVRRQRKNHMEQVQVMKEQIANCICKASRAR
jgi:septal ring factor EnvC (AmiA/AmiB activator)